MRSLVVFVISSTLALPAAAQRARSVRPVDPPLPQRWSAPACEVVRGLPSVRFVRPSDQFTASNEIGPLVNRSALDIVASDRPDRLFAIFESMVHQSDDAGCQWLKLAYASPAMSRVTAAPGGGVYVWGESSQTLLRVRESRVEVLAAPEPPVALGVDPSDADHLRIISFTGKSFESRTAGATWDLRGQLGNVPVYAAAFDPHDFRRIVIGAPGQVAHSRDGGASWARTALANAFYVAISPVDGNVIWVSGVVPGGRETVWRSEDGGLSFTPVAVSSHELPFNRGPLAPHPTQRDLVAFPGWNGLVIADARDRTIRLTGISRRWVALGWSPSGDTIYVAAPDVVLIVN